MTNGNAVSCEEKYCLKGQAKNNCLKSAETRAQKKRRFLNKENKKKKTQ